MNTLVDLLLLLGCGSIVAFRVVGGRRPHRATGLAQPADSRITLSPWVTLSAVLGALVAGSRLYRDLTAASASSPVDGRLVAITCVVIALAAGLWAFRLVEGRRP